MALASLDIVNILNRELPQFGCPASTLSSLAGISSGKLSSYLNGVTRCPHEHELKLRQTWARLKKLVEFAKPLPLDFRKVGELKSLLEQMESQVLTVVVFRTDEQLADDDSLRLLAGAETRQ